MADAEVAQWIAGELEALGYSILFQDRDSAAGGSIPEFMARGSQCDRTIAAYLKRNSRAMR